MAKREYAEVTAALRKAVGATHLLSPKTARKTYCGIDLPMFGSSPSAIWPWGRGVADCRRCLRRAHPLVRGAMAARRVRVRFSYESEGRTRNYSLSAEIVERLAVAHTGRQPREGFGAEMAAD